MRKTLVATVLATLLGSVAVGVAPASAAASSTFIGECGVTVADTTGPPWDLMFDSAIVVYSTTSGDNPVSAKVTCEIRYGSSVDVSATFTGTVVVAGRRTVSGFHNYVGSEICTTIDFTSDATPTAVVCHPLDETTDKALDRTICPILASLSPGIAGVVTIDETGDTVVLGIPFWDCPPYES